MKQFFTLLLLVTSFIAMSKPTTKVTNHQAVKSFEAAYGKSTSATWTCTPAGCQVAFEHKGQYITAVYSHAGKLKWYEKHIASTQLPVSLQLNLKNRFDGYWIADVAEKSGKAGATYVLTLQKGDKKIVLNANGGTWQTTRTTKA